MNRKLSYYESFFHYWGRKNGNFAIGEIIRISCDLELDGKALHLAAEKVCSQYPVWRSVVDTSTTPWVWMERAEDSKEYISVIEVGKEHTIDEFVTRAISTRDTTIFTSNKLVIYFKTLDDGFYDVAFSHSHASMDGSAFLSFLKEFLIELNDILSHNLVEEKIQLMPSNIDENELLAFLLPKLTATAITDQTTSPHRLMKVESELEANQREAMIIRREYTKLSELVAACKANKTTVQSAIVTALGIAQAKAIPNVSNEVTLSVNTPVDIRGLCKRFGFEKDVSQLMGNFISISTIDLPINPTFTDKEIFWNCTRNYKKKLEENIGSGDVFSLINHASQGLEESPNDLFELLTPNEDIQGGRVSNLNVSNLGVIDRDFGEPFGSISLESIHGASWSLNWGDCLYVLAISLRGKLHLSFAYTSIYSKQTMETIATQTMSLLESCT